MTRNRIFGCTALLALGLLVFAVYWPGLDGPFVFDDKSNFIWKPAVQPEVLSLSNIRIALFADGSRWPERGLANLSFAINFLWSDGRFSAVAMKSTNVAIHIANAWLVYLLASALGRRLIGPGSSVPLSTQSLAIATAALWALHPLNLTSVLYTVQRMTSLSALCVLAGLNLCLLGLEIFERKPQAGAGYIAASLLLACLVGTLFKENALLFLPFAFLLGWLGPLNDWYEKAFRSGWPRLLTLATAALVVACAVAFLPKAVTWLVESFEGRDFDLRERLLTQSRVLALYVRMFLLPDLHLFGLHHDAFTVSRGLTAPWSTLTCVAVWLVAIVAALKAIGGRQIWAFALLWFVIGHAMESTVLPLELVHEHRNYLPTVGPAFAVAYYVCRLATVTRRPAVCAVGVLVMFSAMLGSITAVRAHQWSDSHTLMAVGVSHHPQSPRYNAGFAEEHLRATGDIETALTHLKKAARLDANDIDSLMSAYVHGKTRVLQLDAQANSRTGDTLSDAQAEGLELHRRWLASELVGLNRELARRLRSVKFRDESVVSLTRHQQCVTAGRMECVAVRAEAHEWLDLAISNSTLARTWRAQILYVRGVLEANGGNLEKALATWIQARDADPGQVAIHLSLTEAALLLGKPQDAQQYLLRIDAPNQLEPRQHVHFVALSNQLSSRSGHAPQDAGRGQPAE